MNLDDTWDDLLDDARQNEDENSNSKYDRSAYINRNLIFSDRYITAVKSLGESRHCAKHILDSARTMLNHHHGDKYEDLYFICTKTNTVLSRTDYMEHEKEVLPTDAMKQMARDNPRAIISVHNHPDNTLPSSQDITVCYKENYKYGLVVCHNGTIYQYSIIGIPNTVLYEMESSIYERKESEMIEKVKREQMDIEEYVIEHEKLMTKLAAKMLIDANIRIKEVLQNDSIRGKYRPQNP